ncbi:MAG: collagen-like protein [Bacteroidales bacterium]|nr:collagen-like protein [Bacteroidales bacterium]
MKSRLLKFCLVLCGVLALGLNASAQNYAPAGLNYQAVAWNNAGNELRNTPLEVRFSIIPGSMEAEPVYQETHYGVRTNSFGVFNVVIGNGSKSGSCKSSSLAEVAWDQAAHFLKVEIRFNTDNDFRYLGTWPFYAVPYALYAKKSLEPGPAGPKGDPGEKGEPGDPASDDQNLSVVNIDGSDYLAISGGRISFITAPPGSFSLRRAHWEMSTYQN